MSGANRDTENLDSAPPERGDDPRAASSNLPSLSELVAAFGALTLLPCPGWAASASPGRSALFFPLVGLALGGALVWFDRISSGLSESLHSIALVAMLVLLGRGQTLGGLARSGGALVAARNRERALVIVRQGPAGVFGFLVTVLVLAAKVWAIHLLSAYRLWGLLFAPMLARWSMVVSAYSSRAARSGGAGPRFAPDLAFREFALSSVFTFLVVFAFNEAIGIFVVVPIAALTVGLRLIWHRWLGGVTQSTVGATAELAEVVALLLFAAV